jgi:exodeoxyribonuclease V alpha subunit
VTSPTLTLDPSQERAVDLMLRARLCIVTGGPGTGKTTTLRAALDRLDALPMPNNPTSSAEGVRRAAATWDDAATVESANAYLADQNDAVPIWERYMLAAPTGKAARRMMEATGRNAVTVHRLLDYGPIGRGLAGFRHTAERPIPASVVVVDEASMLDTELSDALLDAIDPRFTRLVLVGDVHQLPSVGPGRVMADMIESEAFPVARLTTLHRSAQESWICANAPRVLAGEKPALETRADFEWRAAPRTEDVVPIVVRTVRELTARGATDVQVLAPQRTTSAGVEALNLALQEAFNPKQHGERAWKRDKVQLRPRDRVIQTANNYDLGVMNGEVGEVLRVEEKALFVDFDGRVLEYNAKSGLALDLAYALTTHKSQGSEWPWVVVVCHSAHSHMLDRPLLYTAITRGKAGVVLVGDEKGLSVALGKNDSAKRHTTLKERLQKGRAA